MKKFIAIIAAVLALAIGASAQPRIIKHVGQSFIYGQNLVLSNNTTILFSDTNVYTVVPYGTFYTNQLSSTTNLFNTNLFNPSWNVQVQSFPDYNGNTSSNLSITIALGGTNLIQALNQPVTTNRLANVIVPATASTNTITLLFDRTVDGNYYGTTASDQFSVVVGGGGATQKVICTNLPPNFLVGTKKIRLKSIIADNASSSVGTVINNVTLGGFPP